MLPSPKENNQIRLTRHSAGIYISTGIFQFIWGICKYIPSPIGDVLRKAVLIVCLKKCRAPASFIRTGIHIWWPSRIEIGRTTLNEDIFFNGFGGITIGDYCLIGKGCCFFSEEHTFAEMDKLIIEQPLIKKPIVVEDNVYFGLNCIILGGVTIGKGSVVGAGSVVTKNVPAGAVVAGIPAKVLRYRIPEKS